VKTFIAALVLLLAGPQLSDHPVRGRAFNLTYDLSGAKLFNKPDSLTVVYVFDYWGTKVAQKLRGEHGEGDLYKNVLDPEPDRLHQVRFTPHGSLWQAEIEIPPDARLLSYYITNGTRWDDNGRKTFVSYVYDESGKPVRGARLANVDFMLMAGKSYADIVEELGREIHAYPDNLIAHVVYWRFQYFDTTDPDSLRMLMHNAEEDFARLQTLSVDRDSLLNYEALSFGDVEKILWLSLMQRWKDPDVKELIRSMNDHIVGTAGAIPADRRFPRVNILHTLASDTPLARYDLDAQRARAEAAQREMKKSLAEMVGEPAPDFAFETIAGEKHRLSDFRGKLVFLDFWGSWCGPCVAEIPSVRAAYDRFGPQGVVFISISNDAAVTKWKAEDLRAFTQKKGMTWMQVLDDPQTTITILYKIHFWPNTFLVGRDGTILTRDGLRGDELQATLAKFLADK
jgi:peroxiredoxin